MYKYILIWSVDDYHEMGGGTEFEIFGDIEEATKKVNEITQDKRVSIDFCGQISEEIKFKPVETVTSWEVDLG